MIDLYTAGTPNGHKVSICLEEMQLPYELHTMDLRAGETNRDDYLQFSPNGKIPTIIDRQANDFAVFESGAILNYLAEKTGLFMPTNPRGRSLVMQWLMLQMAGIGPMMGQAFIFLNFFEEKIPSVINRYQQESNRLMGVLDKRLGESEYLAGEYSIADMATYPWAARLEMVGLNIDPFPNLDRWLQVIGKRPGVCLGINNPPIMF